MNIRIGLGYDVHAFEENRKLILGGVEIPFEMGLAGHSDADALLHAIIDSMLGASNLGDIGKLFPDTDDKYKGISSVDLLKEVDKRLVEAGYSVINIDTVIICERPKIGPHTDKMKEIISSTITGLSPSDIGIKGKTTEKLGFTGRKEGIAVQAVCLVSKKG